VSQPPQVAHSVVLRIRATAEKAPDISDVGLFLYDLDSLYEIVRLAFDPAYKAYRFTRFSLYRNGRPLEPRDKMIVHRLRLASPLEVTATIAAGAAAAASVAAALWAFIQTVEKIYNIRLQREKLELEVERLRHQTVQARLPLDLPEASSDPEKVLKRRAATEPLETLSKRLAASPLRVIDVEIEVTDMVPDEPEA
jgi:hypothetical protein